MVTFVLVHPAWLGGWCWRKVTPLLRARGHEVFTPTLTGLGERSHLAKRDIGLETHIQDVVNVLEYEDLSRVILVANSSGGVVITGVADRLPERIARLVYVDAFVPEDGQSLLDIIPPERRPVMESLVRTEGQGWLLPRFAPPPWKKFLPEAWSITEESDLVWVLPRLRPTPFGHFREPLRLARRAGAGVPRTYIRCRWPNVSFDRYTTIARKTAGWRCRELATSHLPYVTHPRELVALLLEKAA
jgi:pimeloyl-ACP methyl ester carboxylesterase